MLHIDTHTTHWHRVVIYSTVRGEAYPVTMLEEEIEMISAELRPELCRYRNGY